MNLNYLFCPKKVPNFQFYLLQAAPGGAKNKKILAYCGYETPPKWGGNPEKKVRNIGKNRLFLAFLGSKTIQNRVGRNFVAGFTRPKSET